MSSPAPRDKSPIDYDKNVPKGWKPIPELVTRPSGFDWSDKLWYMLAQLGGLALFAAGVAEIAYVGLIKLGAWMVAGGLLIFIVAWPTQAEKNGYRST